MELVIVMVCLAVAAALVAPMAGQSAAWQLKAAADMLVADLEYAQTQSLAHSDDCRRLAVEAGGVGYSIVTRSKPATPLPHPIGGAPYTIRFGAGSAAALGRVRISQFNLGGDNCLGFGRSGQLDQPATATLTLSCGSSSLTVSVDAATGEATIGQAQ